MYTYICCTFSCMFKKKNSHSLLNSHYLINSGQKKKKITANVGMHLAQERDVALSAAL